MIANRLISALVTLLVTIDPVGLAPVFLSLTQGMSRSERLEHVQFSPSRVWVPVRGQGCESLVLCWTEGEHGAGLQSGFARPGDRRGAGGAPGPARGGAVQGWDRDSHRLGEPGSAERGTSGAPTRPALSLEAGSAS